MFPERNTGRHKSHFCAKLYKWPNCPSLTIRMAVVKTRRGLLNFYPVDHTDYRSTFALATRMGCDPGCRRNFIRMMLVFSIEETVLTGISLRDERKDITALCIVCPCIIENLRSGWQSYYDGHALSNLVNKLLRNEKLHHWADQVPDGSRLQVILPTITEPITFPPLLI